MPESLTWQKSSFSGGGDGNACIEIAASVQRTHLRESDNPATVLSTKPATLHALIREVKAGKLDAPVLKH